MSMPKTIIIIIIELTHSKTTLENTVEIEPQFVALHFKNLSEYSSCSEPPQYNFLILFSNLHS